MAYSPKDKTIDNISMEIPLNKATNEDPTNVGSYILSLTTSAQAFQLSTGRYEVYCLNSDNTAAIYMRWEANNTSPTITAPTSTKSAGVTVLRGDRISTITVETGKDYLWAKTSAGSISLVLTPLTAN